MMDSRDIIIRPIISEKSTADRELRKYHFEVDKRATKPEIRRAIEEIFDVDVESVHTMNMKGKVKRSGYKTGRRKNWKKAIVALKPGSRDLTEIYSV